VSVSADSPSEWKLFLETLDSFYKSVALIFDLDDTLIDTSESFDQVVKILVEKKSGATLNSEELMALRAEGGFNDDWVATVELLRRRGVDSTYRDIAEEALPLYLDIAPAVETLLFQPEHLAELKKRHPLLVQTGRTRNEYQAVWGERLNALFNEVLCVDDHPHLSPKPSPDGLHYLKERHGFETAFYTGNSVDDMVAAATSGAIPIAVTTNQTSETLERAGAKIVLKHSRDLEQLWMLSGGET
jgi:phosphoglycolate phosphatase-like HAD superfamily hydrolase